MHTAGRCDSARRDGNLSKYRAYPRREPNLGRRLFTRPQGNLAQTWQPQDSPDCADLATIGLVIHADPATHTYMSLITRLLIGGSGRQRPGRWTSAQECSGRSGQGCHVCAAIWAGGDRKVAKSAQRGASGPNCKAKQRDDCENRSACSAKGCQVCVERLASLARGLRQLSKPECENRARKL